jgi:glycerophosphoryl diester phosphodiesterase
MLINKKILVTAHTGCMDTKENSIESALTGIAEGADIIEVDVRFTESGVPVLSHDTVKDEDLESLIKLTSIIEIMRNNPNIMVNLDIKETQGIGSLKEMLYENGIKHRVFFTGIEPNSVDTVREECPGINYLINYAPDTLKIRDREYLKTLVEMVSNYGAIGINLNYRFATEELVQVFHEADKKVYVWTVDDEQHIKNMMQLGVDSITSRQVNLLVNTLKHEGML